jgi:hypothetical protein
VPIRAQEVPHRSNADDALPGQHIPTAHAAVSVPKPCVAGSIPAGGTTIHQEKPAVTSTNTGQGRSCILPPSVAIRPRLPPFAKPLRNGRTALEVMWAASSEGVTWTWEVRREGVKGGQCCSLRSEVRSWG